jgi:hypothetical protein
MRSLADRLRRLSRNAALLALIAAVSTLPAPAQTTFATITGPVTDSSGANVAKSGSRPYISRVITGIQRHPIQWARSAGVRERTGPCCCPAVDLREAIEPQWHRRFADDRPCPHARLFIESDCLAPCAPASFRHATLATGVADARPNSSEPSPAGKWLSHASNRIAAVPVRPSLARA